MRRSEDEKSEWYWGYAFKLPEGKYKLSWTVTNVKVDYIESFWVQSHYLHNVKLLQYSKLENKDLVGEVNDFVVEGRNFEFEICCGFEPDAFDSIIFEIRKN